VQLAFFYENRHPWLIRHDLPLRALARFLCFATPMTLLMLYMLSPSTLAAAATTTSSANVHLGALAAVAVVLILASSLTTARIQTDFIPIWESPGGGRYGVQSFDLCVHLALCALSLALLVTLAPPDSFAALATVNFEAYSHRPLLSELPTHYGVMLTSVLIIALFCPLLQTISSLVALGNLSRISSMIFVMLLASLLSLGPLLLSLLLDTAAEMQRAVIGDSALLAALSSVGQLSPITAFMLELTPPSDFQNLSMHRFGVSSVGSKLYFFVVPNLALLSYLLLRRRLRQIQVLPKSVARSTPEASPPTPEASPPTPEPGEGGDFAETRPKPVLPETVAIPPEHRGGQAPDDDRAGSGEEPETP